MPRDQLFAELDRRLTSKSDAEDVVILTVPNGSVVHVYAWCSPQFYCEVMGGCIPQRPGQIPDTTVQCSSEECRVLRDLEVKYADAIWSALRRPRPDRKLFFTFKYDDFCKGVGKPVDVCRRFLNELCRPESGVCTMSKGKFYGIHYEVTNRGTLTAHLTW